MRIGESGTIFVIKILLLSSGVFSWIPFISSVRKSQLNMAATATPNLHGQNSCFLPMQSSDDDFHFPRIVQVRIIYAAVSYERN